MIFPGGALAAFGLGAGLGYIAGSFPSAYLAGRLVRGVDLRSVGSGNLGATNVLREVGVPAAIAVLLLDAAKGWAPVALLPDALGASTSSWLPIVIGAGAILGHTRPLFLLWKGGGKGVATAAGAFLALAPLALAVAACVFVIGVAATRFVSVGSIAAAAVLPFAVAATAGTGVPVFVASVIVSLYVVWMHRANIGRLMRGEEPPMRAARRRE